MGCLWAERLKSWVGVKGSGGFLGSTLSQLRSRFCGGAARSRASWAGGEELGWLWPCGLVARGWAEMVEEMEKMNFKFF